VIRKWGRQAYVRKINSLFLKTKYPLPISDPSYFLIFLSMGILVFFQMKAQVYSKGIKNSKGSAIIFDDDCIIYRKNSGEEKRFLKNESKFFKIMRIHINPKKAPIILKAKNKFYFIGPIEYEEDFLKHLADNNIPIKTKKNHRL
jgi:hypothetical protein